MPTNNAIDLTSQGVAYYNGTGTFSGLDGSTSGFALTSNGTGVAPSFQSLSVPGGFNGQIGSVINGPADSTTYYLVCANMDPTNFNTSTIGNRASCLFVMPKAVTINKVVGAVVVTTPGTAENCTLFIRVNDSSNTNITTTLKLNAATNTVSNTSLGLSLSAGDYFAFGFTTPAWVTNPVGCRFFLTFSE